MQVKIMLLMKYFYERVGLLMNDKLNFDEENDDENKDLLMMKHPVKQTESTTGRPVSIVDARGRSSSSYKNIFF